MNATVVAAIIAGGLTLIGTLATQILARRATKRDLMGQGDQLDRRLTQQREQLDRTLAEQRARTLNERFAIAASQLGGNQPPAVRLAGVYAMAGLADDWPENRQTCVDVLCAYLRMPYKAAPPDEALEEYWIDFRANREVRHTVIRVITAHLQDDASVSWQDLDLDFTGVVFDGGEFTYANFSGGRVSFHGAKFASGTIGFGATEYSGGTVDFSGVEFSGAKVSFVQTKFSRGQVFFSGAEFSGGEVIFHGAKFCGGVVGFWDARFSGGTVDFSGFGGAEFSGGTVYFEDAEFSGGTVNFNHAKFSGGRVVFSGAEFSGATADFTDPGDWSVPPEFPWTGVPPQGVMLPKKEDQSGA
jgi:uncharacterized protein YjbI with pentapeptide repeats